MAPGEAESIKMLSAIIKGADITEVYSPSRINGMCADCSLKAGSPLDLTAGWDFSVEEHREAARSRIKKECPA